jgi:hypothetical protein
MTRLCPLSPDVRALLDRERAIPQPAAATRARALNRARAALVAAGTGTASAASSFALPLRWAVALALVCATGGAVAAAYQIGPPAAPAPAAAPIQPSKHPPGVPSHPTARVRSTIDADPAQEAPKPPRADIGPTELRLMKQVRAAVARRDFEAALPSIARHARLFQDGRLVEEREALRVHALAGLGRWAKAQQAAAAFETRFPRSVLLPVIRELVTAPSL